jgi:adenylate cyclase
VADGLTTLITAELVSFRQFFVLARRSATALASGDADAIAAARAAALDYVVDGTVRREGDAFVVTASLVDTTSGQAVWSETFRESATGSEVLELESRIAGAIVTALAQPYGILNRQLARAAHRADLPDKLSSYACILEADHYYATYAMADFRSALACLEATLAAEPDYAHAWAYLAYLRLDALRYGYGLETAEGTIEAALAAASRALDLEPENAMAQRAMAAVLFTEGDLEGFRRHAELALELNPNDSDALADLGGKIAYSGDWERGLALRRQAIERNPAHPPAYRIPFAFDAFRRGDDAVALAELDRIGLSNFLITSLLRAAVLGRHGPPAAAEAAVAELLALQPDAASYARDYFRYWNLSPELVDDLLDGLSRAGLDVST